MPEYFQKIFNVYIMKPRRHIEIKQESDIELSIFRKERIIELLPIREIAN